MPDDAGPDEDPLATTADDLTKMREAARTVETAYRLAIGTLNANCADTVGMKYLMTDMLVAYFEEFRRLLGEYVTPEEVESCRSMCVELAQERVARAVAAHQESKGGAS